MPWINSACCPAGSNFKIIFLSRYPLSTLHSQAKRLSLFLWALGKQRRDLTFAFVMGPRLPSSFLFEAPQHWPRGWTSRVHPGLHFPGPLPSAHPECFLCLFSATGMNQWRPMGLVHHNRWLALLSPHPQALTLLWFQPLSSTSWQLCCPGPFSAQQVVLNLPSPTCFQLSNPEVLILKLLRELWNFSMPAPNLKPRKSEYLRMEPRH